MTLGDLEVGKSGIIAGYSAGGLGFREKLLSMGLTKGVEVSVKRVAPLGDPLQVTVRDFSLSIRKDEDKLILLKD